MSCGYLTDSVSVCSLIQLVGVAQTVLWLHDGLHHQGILVRIHVEARDLRHQNVKTGSGRHWVFLLCGWRGPFSPGVRATGAWQLSPICLDLLPGGSFLLRLLPFQQSSCSTLCASYSEVVHVVLGSLFYLRTIWLCHFLSLVGRINIVHTRDAVTAGSGKR